MIVIDRTWVFTFSSNEAEAIHRYNDSGVFIISDGTSHYIQVEIVEI